MEVLVLIDFEGTMGDEMTVHAGDVVKKVTKTYEEGWLEGELRGKRGIFPANFVKEVPVYLIGDSKREPRSLRKSRMPKTQSRKCEVAFAYTPVNEDELELVVGETIEILREIEDGWLMGKKNGNVGAFPSNFVTEIFVSPKDTKLNEGKTRPKLSDAVFNKEAKLQQRASVRKKTENVRECCQVMFDYAAYADDELDLKKGDIVIIISKDTEDEGWWEGELNGGTGFFPDNFVMVIPADALQCANVGQPPVRRGSEKHSVKQEASVMDKNNTDPRVETKDEKPDTKDLRSDPPSKVKLPGLRKAPPPPVKDKPHKFVPKTNGDLLPPILPKHTDKDSDQFDGVEVSSEKLSHPTANRAKPPQRRPPSALVIDAHGSSGADQSENSADTDESPKKLPVLPKVTENCLPSPNQTEQLPKLPSSPPRPAAPRVTEPTAPAMTLATAPEERASLDEVMAEVRELRMSLELLKTRHERDMQEIKDELQEERSKRIKLQEEVQALRTKQ